MLVIVLNTANINRKDSIFKRISFCQTSNILSSLLDHVLLFIDVKTINLSMFNETITSFNSKRQLVPLA